MGLPATEFAQTLVPCNATALQTAVAAANTAGGGPVAANQPNNCGNPSTVPGCS